VVFHDLTVRQLRVNGVADRQAVEERRQHFDERGGVPRFIFGSKRRDDADIQEASGLKGVRRRAASVIPA
jgi:hypothetical protein